MKHKKERTGFKNLEKVSKFQKVLKKSIYEGKFDEKSVVGDICIDLTLRSAAETRKHDSDIFGYGRHRFSDRRNRLSFQAQEILI